VNRSNLVRIPARLKVLGLELRSKKMLRKLKSNLRVKNANKGLTQYIIFYIQYLTVGAEIAL
jgi:hypothetical protein